MFISDKNLIAEIDRLKSIGKIRTKNEAYEIMGIDRTRANQIRNQDRYKQSFHFSAEQIRLFCNAFGVSADKILGIKNCTKTAQF